MVLFNQNAIGLIGLILDVISRLRSSRLPFLIILEEDSSGNRKVLLQVTLLTLTTYSRTLRPTRFLELRQILRYKGYELGTEIRDTEGTGTHGTK